MLNRNACPDFTPLSPDELTGEEMARPETTYFKDVWRNLKKRKTAIVSLFVLGLLVVMVLVGPMMNEYNYYSNDYSAANQPPSPAHWFGTDTLGRDLWTRVRVGGRVSLLIAILATIIPYAIGMMIGGISGYFGGKVDMFIMRLIDVLMGIPSLIYDILLIMVLGSGSIATLVIAFTITGWLGSARTTRTRMKCASPLTATRCFFPTKPSASTTSRAWTPSTSTKASAPANPCRPAPSSRCSPRCSACSLTGAAPPARHP